ncbi:MAG: HlyD family efflux transporter periplasmic adaptor subunit [Rhizobiales bacterium]|nr:HlyD family efflux transporter periplasmic adaptor subunit [Hyphomicrobiales bacterium]
MPDWSSDTGSEVRLARAKRVTVLVALLLAIAIAWSYFAVLDEVSTGSGRVVPSSKEQVIQSLEGGILASLNVSEDETVAPGQILAQLDPTRTESNVEESAAKYRAALASSVRLEAEVNGTSLRFPAELDTHPDLIAKETQLYAARKESLESSLKLIGESLKLLRDELKINESLVGIGAASTIEVIRLRRQQVELEMKQTDLKSQYLVQAREELAKANAEMNSLASVVKGRADSLSRLTQRSPVRGIVKNIAVATIGGVVPPGGKLMDIIPLDGKLLIETKVSPRDIAFIRPDQQASVKVSAYDYAIYGALKGRVTTISPDTIQDETDPKVYYFRVYVQTETDALVNRAGRRFPISPGMIATVDIHTGSKSVFDYLVKPFNRAREALRER